MIDEHIREFLRGLVERNITGRDLIDLLARIASTSGCRGVGRSDNRPVSACTA